MNNTPEQQDEANKKYMIKTYGPVFMEVEKLWMNIYSYGNSIIDREQFMEFLAIVDRHEQLSDYYGQINWQENNNYCSIYSEYLEFFTQSDPEEFIKLLMYAYRLNIISFFIPENKRYSPNKIRENEGYFRDPMKIVEPICFLYSEIISKKPKASVVIFFTNEGEQFRKNQLRKHAISGLVKMNKENNALLETIRVEITKVQDENEKLRLKINDHNKEVISIITIILAIAPILAFNFAEIKELKIDRILIINGCLLLGITSLFFIVITGFFEFRKKHWLLLFPLFFATWMIYLGVSNSSFTSICP